MLYFLPVSSIQLFLKNRLSFLPQLVTFLLEIHFQQPIHALHSNSLILAHFYRFSNDADGLLLFTLEMFDVGKHDQVLWAQIDHVLAGDLIE
jgi:hypothetical protein